MFCRTPFCLHVLVELSKEDWGESRFYVLSNLIPRVLSILFRGGERTLGTRLCVTAFITNCNYVRSTKGYMSV